MPRVAKHFTEIESIIKSSGVGKQKIDLYIKLMRQGYANEKTFKSKISVLRTELVRAYYEVHERTKVIKELYSELNNTARYFHDINAILKHDDNLYDGQRKLNVKKDGDKEFLPIGFNPRQVLCVLTAFDGDKKDSRKKVIYEWRSETKQLNKYYLNTQKGAYGNLKKIRDYIDPLGHYLLLASQSAILNIDYYEFEGEHSLQLNFVDKRIESEAIKIIVPDRTTDLRKLKTQMIKIRADRESRQFSHEKAEFYIKEITDRR